MQNGAILLSKVWAVNDIDISGSRGTEGATRVLGTSLSCREVVFPKDVILALFTDVADSIAEVE